MPQWSMGFLAESRPRFERDVELQVQGQQLEYQADELIISVMESEGYYNQVLARGIYLASERGTFTRELATLQSQLEGFKRELEERQREAQEKRAEFMRLRDVELELGDRAADLEENAKMQKPR